MVHSFLVCNYFATPHRIPGLIRKENNIIPGKCPTSLTGGMAAEKYIT